MVSDGLNRIVTYCESSTPSRNARSAVSENVNAEPPRSCEFTITLSVPQLWSKIRIGLLSPTFTSSNETVAGTQSRGAVVGALLSAAQPQKERIEIIIARGSQPFRIPDNCFIR